MSVIDPRTIMVFHGSSIASSGSVVVVQSFLPWDVRRCAGLHQRVARDCASKCAGGNRAEHRRHLRRGTL